MLYRTSNRVLNNGIKVIILICMDGTSQYHHYPETSLSHFNDVHRCGGQAWKLDFPILRTDMAMIESWPKQRLTMLQKHHTIAEYLVGNKYGGYISKQTTVLQKIWKRSLSMHSQLYLFTSKVKGLSRFLLDFPLFCLDFCPFSHWWFFFCPGEGRSTLPISSPWFEHLYVFPLNFNTTGSKEALLRGHNWMHLAHRLQCTVTMNSNFTILKTRNCFQLE